MDKTLLKDMNQMRDSATVNPHWGKVVKRGMKEIEALQSCIDSMQTELDSAVSTNGEMQSRIDELQDFAIWMTGCGYDFCQHDYFCQQRDKLLKDLPTPPEKPGCDCRALNDDQSGHEKWCASLPTPPEKG